MTDDSGSHPVFTEQGWPASQMTAAKVMYVIARLPDCAGQAADAVSNLFPCQKMVDTSKVRMFIYVDTSSTTNVPNHGQTLKIQ